MSFESLPGNRILVKSTKNKHRSPLIVLIVVKLSADLLVSEEDKTLTTYTGVIVMIILDN